MNIFKVEAPISDVENIDYMFKYLQIKYCIEVDLNDDLKELFKDNDEYQDNYSILKDLLEDKDFYNTFAKELRISIENFVYYSRENLDKDDKDFNKNWENLNNLIVGTMNYYNIDDIDFNIALNNLIDTELANRDIHSIKFKNIDDKLDYLRCLSYIDLIVYSGIYLNDQIIKDYLNGLKDKKIVNYGTKSIESIKKEKKLIRKRDF